MWSKRLMAVLGAVATSLVVLAFNVWAADKFYMRFMFKGESVSEFAPGDTFGEILVFGVFTLLGIFTTIIFWSRVYRRVSRLG
jgi:hypothetical protein